MNPENSAGVIAPPPLIFLAGLVLDLGFMRDGLYRFTRNPGYLGMALWSSGIALGFAAPWALLGVALAALFVDRGVIAREERDLEGIFGDEHRAYRTRVRRWL